ncbi:MAG: hypothetical protein Q9168_006233, partial [Polycauliona sp. 1 TL-2023]
MAFAVLRALTIISLCSLIKATSNDRAPYSLQEGNGSPTTPTAPADQPETVFVTPEPSGLFTSYRPASDSSGAESSKASGGKTPSVGTPQPQYGTNVPPGPRQNYPLFYNASSLLGPTGTAAASGFSWNGDFLPQQSTGGLSVPSDCPPPSTVTIQNTITAPPTTVNGPQITVTVTSTIPVQIQPVPGITPTVTLTITTTVCTESSQHAMTAGNGNSDEIPINGGGRPGVALTTEGVAEPSPPPDSGIDSVDVIPSPIPSPARGGSHPPDVGPGGESPSYQPLSSNSTENHAPSLPETGGDDQYPGNTDQQIPSMERPSNTSLPANTGDDGNAMPSGQSGSGGEEVTSGPNSDQEHGESGGTVKTLGANTTNELPAEVSSGNNQDSSTSQMSPESSASLLPELPVQSGFGGNQNELGEDIKGTSTVPPYGFDSNTSFGPGSATGSYISVTDMGTTSATDKPQHISSDDQGDQDTSSRVPYISTHTSPPIETTAVYGSERSSIPIPSNSTNTRSYGLPPYVNSTASLLPGESPYQPLSGTGATFQGSSSLPPTTSFPPYQSLPHQTPVSRPSNTTQQGNMSATSSNNKIANQTSSDTGVVFTTMIQEVIPLPAKPANNGSSEHEDTGDRVDKHGSTTTTPSNNVQKPLPTASPTVSLPINDDKPIKSPQLPPLPSNTSRTPLGPLPTTTPSSSPIIEEHKPVPSLPPQPPPSNTNSTPFEPSCIPSQGNRPITVDFNNLEPSSPLPNPYQSITYTGFSVSPASTSSRLSAFASEPLKTIAIAAPAKHFNLTSISLGCDAPPCNITMWGTKVQTKTATGAAAGMILTSLTKVEKKD